MTGQEISNICNVHTSSISRDFAKSIFKLDNAEIDIEALFASVEHDAILLQKKYAALQVEAMQDKLNAMTKQNDAISLQLSNEQKTFTQLQTKLSNTEQKLKSSEQTETALKEKYNLSVQTSKQNNTTQDENTTLRNDLNRLTDVNNDLVKDNSLLQTDCNELIVTCKALKQDCNAKTTNNTDLQATVTTLQEQNNTLQTDLNSLSDASEMINSLHQKTELQRTEILNFKTGQNSKNTLQDFFTSLKMIQFYTVLVLLGTFFVAFQKWSEFEIYQTGWGGKVTVFILAFLLSSSVIFTAFNKTKYVALNYLVLFIFVFIEFINSAKLTGLFETGFASGDFFKALGGSLLLPTISVFVAHLNTATSKTYSLDAILSTLESVGNDFKIEKTTQFKNDFLEKIIKTK